jgi:hypothetical protein
VKILKGCIVAALALGAGAWAERARADEAYICDAGRVVYVKPGELETKKLLDPCIAKYFENTPTATKSTAVIPVIGPSAGERAPVAAAPDKPGDYRNVRIINATPGSDAWFVHRR